MRLQRAYSPRDVQHIRRERIPLEGDWQRVFGQPEWGDPWFIIGPSASGKSSFVMQLCKALSRISGVLYVSLEEGIGLTMKERLARFKMNECQGRFRLITDCDMDDLKARLKKAKSARFIIIDSIQFACDSGWDYQKTKELYQSFPRKTFIFISQQLKSEPVGKSAGRLKYACGVKVETKGYRAFCLGRYSQDVSAYYDIWPERSVEVWNGK